MKLFIEKSIGEKAGVKTDEGVVSIRIVFDNPNSPEAKVVMDAVIDLFIEHSISNLT